MDELVKVVSTTITYTYDPLGRLKNADNNDGTYLHYTYDAVGNRLTETALGGAAKTYTYDAANRLTSADGVSYTWDNNGNLLSDGVNAYTYDHANRLTAASRPGSAVSYGYNGLGDRLQQTANSVTTNYTVDLNAGLTQVLSDGTNIYLYGAGRIAQQSAAGKEYFLGDALGSVRQLADATGAVSLARSYQPYGKLLASDGSGVTSYGFTGEWTSFNELVYLRARWYAPRIGIFLSPDLWSGNPGNPATFNEWSYVEADPVNHIDPSGLRRIKIWAAAFIKDAIIGFPHIYIPKYWDETYEELVYNVPIGVATIGIWNGNGRDFYNGGNRLSSKVWHEVVIETNPFAPSPLVSNDADTDRTKVNFVYYGPSGLGYGYATAKAPKPPLAIVVRPPSLCTIYVDIDIYKTPDSGRNPLGPEIPGVKKLAPPIRYRYSLVFDLTSNTVRYSGQHSAFPWHELWIEGVSTPPRQYIPDGPTQAPWDLFDFIGNERFFGPKAQPIPTDPVTENYCSKCR